MAKKKYIITEKSEVTSKEYINKRADIVAEVTGTDIDIKLDSTQNDSYCYLEDLSKDERCTCVHTEAEVDDGKVEDPLCPRHNNLSIVPKYNIVLGRTGGVPTKTLAYHELSHILHDSLSTTIFDKEVYGRSSVEFNTKISSFDTGSLSETTKSSPNLLIHSKYQRAIIERVLGQQQIIDDCTDIYNIVYETCMNSKYMRYNTARGELQWVDGSIDSCRTVESTLEKISDSMGSRYNDMARNRLRIWFSNPSGLRWTNSNRKELSRVIATQAVKQYVIDIKYGTASLTTETMLATFNVLEDQRIESLTGLIWLGTVKMFTKAKETLGKLLASPMKTSNTNRQQLDPVTALLAQRFGHLDNMISIVRNNSGRVGLTDEQLDTIKESLSMCEFVGKEIPLRVLQTKLLPILTEFIVEQMLINSKRRKQDSISEAEAMTSELDNQLIGKCQPPIGDDSDGQPDTRAQDNYDDKTKEMVKKNEDKIDDYSTRRHNIGNPLPNEYKSGKNGSDNTTSTTDGEFLSRTTTTWNTRGTRDEDWNKYVRVQEHKPSLEEKELDMDSLDNDEVITKEELTNSKEEAKDNMSTLREILTGEGNGSNEPAHIKRFPRTKAPYEVDSSVVSSMTHILKELKEKFKPKLTEYGDEVDIDAYIDLKNAGHGAPFIEQATVKGLDIFITIDGSGSMSGVEIDTARNMCANFFKMAEHNNDINVKANVWSGNSEGEVCITPIETLSDCQMITTNVEVDGSQYTYRNNYYSTPTHEGIKYSVERFKTMNSKNKLFILVTDGFPAHTSKGYEIPFEIMVKKVNHELTKARRMPNVSVLTIMLGTNNSGWTEYLWKMYKDTWIGLKDMSKAKGFIEKQVRRKIAEVFRS